MSLISSHLISCHLTSFHRNWLKRPSSPWLRTITAHSISSDEMRSDEMRWNEMKWAMWTRLKSCVYTNDSGWWLVGVGPVATVPRSRQPGLRVSLEVVPWRLLSWWQNASQELQNRYRLEPVCRQLQAYAVWQSWQLVTFVTYPSEPISNVTDDQLDPWP